MADPGPLRARLGELARARKARMGPEAARETGPNAEGSLVAADDPSPEAAGREAARRTGGSAGAAGLARTGRRLSTDTLAFQSVSAPRREPRSGDVPPGFSAPAVGVEEFLPGGEWRDSPDFTGRPGAVYVHERLRSEIEKRKPHWGRIEPPPPHEPALAALAAHGLEHALFLDLETCGLASSAVFLAGTMHWNGEDFVLRQYFARHYGEEGPLLRALNESMAGFEHLVTFNGKTFDVPFLQGRAVVHGVRLALPPHHLDLLHAARRRWRGEFADCRLKTLESRVCRRHRVGDVPGEEIPGLYHDYVKHGDPYRLVPVFHHNLLDVITMSDILRALCRPARTEPARARPRRVQ
jgi:uncharacterized protein YprB with RNaseH-like and TPR domain